MGTARTGRARSLLGPTVLALSVLAPGAARADDGPKRAIVQAMAVAPDVCFDGSSLAASVGAWLKQSEIDARISVLVRRPNAENVRFTVERGEKLVGERDMPVATLPCPDLRAAVALAIAIAIDHTLLDSLGIEAPATTPTERESPPARVVREAPRPRHEEPEPAPPPPPAPRPKPVPEPPARGLELAVEGEALFGLLPGPALGAVPRVGFAPVPELELRASALGTTRAQAHVGGGTTSASLLAGRLDACVRGPERELRGALCLGGAYGSMSAEGSGLSPSYSPSVHWAAALARVEARYPAHSRLALVAAVDGVVPLLRPELQVVDRQGNVADDWRAPNFGFGVALGADLWIW